MDRMNWTATDFATAAVLLLCVGAAIFLMARAGGSLAYRLALGGAILTAVLLVWVNGAVGIVGSEADDFNMLYFGVPLVGAAGAVIARFRSRGMAFALLATAGTVIALAATALAIGRQAEPGASLAEIAGVNGMFAALFVGSALLFWRAAHDNKTGKAV